jgi:hypothetical protein
MKKESENWINQRLMKHKHKSRALQTVSQKCPFRGLRFFPSRNTRLGFWRARETGQPRQPEAANYRRRALHKFSDFFAMATRARGPKKGDANKMNFPVRFVALVMRWSAWRKSCLRAERRSGFDYFFAEGISTAARLMMENAAR